MKWVLFEGQIVKQVKDNPQKDRQLNWSHKEALVNTCRRGTPQTGASTDWRPDETQTFRGTSQGYFQK